MLKSTSDINGIYERIKKYFIRFDAIFGSSDLYLMENKEIAE